MRYVIGLDGGGTKTAAERRAADGTILERAVFGPLNLNGGVHAAEQTLKDCIAWLRDGTDGLENCAALCAGTAGISNPEARAFLENGIRSMGYNGPLLLVGDQITALAGALEAPVGTVLIAGTGSICYGRCADGTERRAGGWGHLIDDEGSGYAIGRDILRAAVRAEDGRGPRTVLTRGLSERLGSTKLQEWMRFVYAPATGKKEIASLATLLVPALEQQDAAACKIAENAAEELERMARAVLEPPELRNGCMALLGSVLQKNETIRKLAAGRLQTRYPQLLLCEPRGDAAHGAAEMALRALDEKGE